MSRRSRLFVSTQVKDWGQSPLTRVPYVFSPAEVSPQLWLDASDAGTITASSGDVSQWNNKGSLGNFTQATGALQPKTGVTTQNGLNVVDFAGDYVTAANQNEWKFLHDGTKYIVAAAIKFGTGSDPNTVYPFMGNNGFTGSQTGVTFSYDDRSGSSRNNALFVQVTASDNNFNVVSHVVNDIVTPNTFSIVTMIMDPANGTANNRSEFFVNAGTGSKGNTSTLTPSSGNPSQVLRVGDSAGSSLTGSIAELVVVSGANATETNRAKLRDYLDDKWSVY